MDIKTVKLNDGNKIPHIGFGTWQIEDEDESSKLVKKAIETGYRLIDTAAIYNNEAGVGEGISGSKIAREELFITTKLWNDDQGYDSAFEALRLSLKKLNLNYVDLYLLHWPIKGKRLESWRALEELNIEGLAKSIGVSNFTVRHLEELTKNSKTLPSINQVEFHPFIYNEQKKLLEFCKNEGIVLQAYSPLAHATRMDNEAVKNMTTKYKKSYAQILLRWSLQHGVVPIPKSSNEERIKENLDICDFVIDENDMVVLNNLGDGTRTCSDPNEME